MHCLTKWVKCDIVTVAAGDISPHAELRYRLPPVLGRPSGRPFFFWSVCLLVEKGHGSPAWVGGDPAPREREVRSQIVYRKSLARLYPGMLHFY